MILQVKLLTDNAVVPAFAHVGDAGADITATSYSISTTPNGLSIHSYGTGLAFAIPDGYEMQIRPRSSIYKTGAWLCNGVGTIDSGYRGEVQCKFYSLDTTPPYQIGDRVAQLIIHQLPRVAIEAVLELSDTERGTGGFGSTGV
jgi:dUTP pyrophosphatase